MTPDTCSDNVIPFPAHRLSRRDRVILRQWVVAAKPLGIQAGSASDDGPAQDAAASDRVVIELQPQLADRHFILIFRPSHQRAWTTLLLRAEADGSMTLPIGSAVDAFRESRTLREALNAIRPLLSPDEDCRVLDYRPEMRSAAGR